MKLTSFALIATYLVVNSYASPISNPDDPIIRIKRAHTGDFSEPASSKIRKNVQACVATWKDDSAREKVKSINCDTGVRIDRQGVEYHTNSRGESVKFERYAVQYQSFTYSVVHLQVGVAFGKKAIKDAFIESMKHQAHIFFTNGLFNKISSGGGTYERKRYPRSGFRDTWVHTTHSAMNSICKDVSCDKKSS